VEEEEAAASRFQHPGHLLDRGLHGIDVFDHEAHHHRVEGTVAEWQRFGRRLSVPRPTAAIPGHRDLVPGGIDADNAGTERRGPSCDLAFAATTVEHASGTRETPL